MVQKCFRQPFESVRDVSYLIHDAVSAFANLVKLQRHKDSDRQCRGESFNGTSITLIR